MFKVSCLSILFLIFNLISNAYVAKAKTSNDYSNFTKSVIKSFSDSKAIEESDNNNTIVAKKKNGEIFNFVDTLYNDYNNFAQDRFNNNDYIDAFYFKTKANKIKKYKIIAPANPYSFGILPDDINQFIIAREQLKNVSINSILNSNDGLVLEDSYIAFDCWLEAFENSNSNDRAKRCRSRLIDNLKALRLSLLSQGYNLFEMTTKEDLVLNNRLSTCETCKMFNKGLYCNSLYFNTEEATMIDKMNIVVKRLQEKLSFFSTATVQIMYYKNAYGYDKKLSLKRLNAVKNLTYNTLLNDNLIKPEVKIVPITLSKEEQQKKIFRDVITVCVSGNE